MNWIASKVVVWLILEVLSVVVFFLSQKESNTRRWALGSLVVFAVLLTLGGYRLLVSAPGLEETVNEQDAINPKPNSKHLDRLRADWDSEEKADWPVAETLALFCQIAYKPPVDARDAFKQLGINSVETIADGSMIGYVIALEDVTVVVFRGSDDSFDWFCNLNSLTTPTPQGAIHRGFLQSYGPLKPQITKLLGQQKPRHLWLTGHSLGGALAVVAAHDLIENEKAEVRGVMTFGQPMVAGKELAAHLDRMLLGRYAHFVNGSDVVARVPPFLKHCGSLVWFTADGIKRSRPRRVAFGDPKDPPAEEDLLPPLSEQEFEKAKAEVRENRGPSKLPDGTPIYKGNSPFLRDHSMDLYLEKIRKNNNGTGELIAPEPKEGK